MATTQPSTLKKFNFNSQRLFATYPHCGCKHQALQFFRDSFPVESAVIGLEYHQDGSPHIHCLIIFDRQIHKRKADCFDFIVDMDTFHGNYQKVRNVNDVLKYITKHDKEPLTFNYDVAAKLQATAKKQKYTNMQVIQTPIVTLIENETVSIGMAPKLQQAKDFYFMEKARSDLIDVIDSIPNPWTDLFPIDFDLKQRHIWVWSTGPNLGKTTWLKQLDQKYKCGWYTYSETFQPFHRDTQLVLCDEFSGKISITQLNQMCDGTYQYPTKGAMPTLIRKPLIIIASNRSIVDVYPKFHQFASARFTEICLDEYYNTGNGVTEDNMDLDLKYLL